MDHDVASVAQQHILVVVANELIEVLIVASVKMYVSGLVSDVPSYSKILNSICAGTTWRQVQSTDEIADTGAYHNLITECHIACVCSHTS